MPFTKLALHKNFSHEKLKKNPLFSDEKLALIDLYCAHPGQSQPVHGHAHAAKAYVILEGLARVTIGDDVREIGPGEIAFSPKGIAHGIEAIGPSGLVALVFIAGSL